MTVYLVKLRQEDCPVNSARPQIIENYRKWAGEMAQRVKVLIAKPALSLTLEPRQ